MLPTVGFCIGLLCGQSGADFEVGLEAGPASPLCVTLPNHAPSRRNGTVATLVHATAHGKKEVPCQVEEEAGRTYLGAASPGLSLLSLHRTKPVTLRYRIVVHAGTSGEADSEGHSRRFSSPPSVTWR